MYFAMISHCTNSQFKNVKKKINDTYFQLNKTEWEIKKKYGILNSACILIIFFKFCFFSGYPGFALMRYTQVDESNWNYCLNLEC